jgi:hypothetical protein
MGAICSDGAMQALLRYRGRTVTAAAWLSYATLGRLLE